MNNEDTFWLVFGSMVMGAFLLTIVADITDVSPSDINRKWRKEAIALGYGKWVVDADGNTTFEWIKLDNEKKPDTLKP